MTDVPAGLTPHILPGILREIAEAAGLQAAVDLCVAARGRKLYIPERRRLSRKHPLVQAVGWNAACAISRVLGGQDYLVPTARPVLRAYRARVLRTAGYTTGQIAMILDMNRKHVQRLAPVSEYPRGTVDKRALQAILDDAPRRFSRMKPGEATAASPAEAAPNFPLFEAAGLTLPE